MKFYWIKTHRLIKYIFSNYIWSITDKTQTVYLTFDDGPTPEVTEWTLAQLDQYNAKATFFCIGDNIQKHPELFTNIIAAGHSIGNHTFNHVNGWHTNLEDYINNVKDCEAVIESQMSKVESRMHISAVAADSNSQLVRPFAPAGVKIHNSQLKLFRPPYGRIKFAQSRRLRKMGYKIIMWDILSADFDTTISSQQCLDNVLKNICPGSIVIFHDSIKAFKNLKYALPETLRFLQENGYKCEVLS